MNRFWFRILGVALGIVLGTLAAVTSKILRKQAGGPATREAVNADSDDESAVDPWDTPNPPKPNDPGKRRLLAQLVESAGSEEKWLKDFVFTDPTGKEVSSEQLKGQPYVVCFFFTTCTGSCPRQTSQMQLLTKKYKDQPIRFVSITVDPETDSPEVLKEYAERFGANPEKWYFLRGEMDYTQRVGTEKFFLDGVEKRGHPDRFCLVNSDGNIVGSYLWMDIDERDLLEKHIAELLN